MKKLLLIQPVPRPQLLHSRYNSWNDIPSLALGYVAALTPRDWKIRIVCESVEKLDLSTEADLVGISVCTSNATRAYEIAARFRERKIPVVLGGVHVSMLPDEGVQHADSVVVGEAESVWGKVIEDFLSGALKPVYHGERLPLDNLPIPRRDLYPKSFEMDVVQTTRGCPFTCEYCATPAFYGNKYRRRPVKDILDELETIEKKLIYFADDNLFGAGEESKESAIALFRGMIERKFKFIWGTQASLNISKYPEVLKLAFKAGCRVLYVGIESMSAEVLKDLKKKVNLRIGTDHFKESIKVIHDSGIIIVGAFIFGNGEDDLRVFRKTLDFINEVGVDVPDLSILTGMPGTPLADRMKEEQRVIYSNFPDDWDKYDTRHVMYRYKNIDVMDVVRGVDFISRNRFSIPAILTQTAKSLIRTRSPIAALYSFYLNLDSRRLHQSEIAF